MIEIKVVTQSVFDATAQGYAFFLRENFAITDVPAEIQKKFFPNLEQLFAEREFTGKQSSVVVVHVSHEKRVMHLIFVGLGAVNKQKKFEIESLRRAVGKLVRTCEAHKIASVAVTLPQTAEFGLADEYLLQQVVTTAHMAGYHFDEFKSDRLSDKKIEIQLCVSEVNKKMVDAAVARGELIARAVNRTRHWVDTPPSRLTPTILAEHAQKVAAESGLAITVFGEPEIIKMGMGGLAAVAAGSEQDCKFIILEYKSAQKNAPTLALVGKGITFDSGGLSLKPANSMETMKEDMAGAGAVISAIGALAQLKPEINLIAFAPTTENLPSGTATKPGDIIRFYNGKTAEVKNTDAEGRLILADALSYAVKHYKPDFMIDLATLTGACDYACGPFYSGLLTQDDAFAARVERASYSSGDRVWRLPMHDDYAVAISSDVADMSNTGKSNYRAGTITATFFLKHFVGDTPWVHLDIASNAFDMPGVSYYESGATGIGVRLLIDLVMDWNKK
jgi:leucyl aminopeptidase